MPSPATRRIPVGIGVVEILAGSAVVLGGCYMGISDGASMATVAAFYSFIAGVGALILPGALLFARSPYRWLGQLIAAPVAAWLLLVIVSLLRHH